MATQIYYGEPRNCFGAFVFSNFGTTNILPELSLCTIVHMSGGKLFVHIASSFVLDSFDPLFAYWWFEWLLFQANPPNEHLLTTKTGSFEAALTELKEQGKPTYPLLTVAYQEDLQHFFGTFKPEWKAFPCSQENYDAYVLKYRVARTKKENEDNPPLLFSHPQQQFLISPNTQLQIALGMALTLFETHSNMPIDIKAGDFTLTNKHYQEEKLGSTFCVTR